jgi:hypothetical protein
MTQFARGEPLSLEYLTWNAPRAFLFGLHNSVRAIDYLIAQRMHPPSADDEFMGMMDYVVESFHDLLTRDSEMISDSDSSGGSHQPSCECFMADTPEGLLVFLNECRRICKCIELPL